MIIIALIRTGLFSIKNRRSPSSLSLSERDSVRPNLKSTAHEATQAAIGNFSLLMVIIDVIVSRGRVMYVGACWSRRSRIASYCPRSSSSSSPEIYYGLLHVIFQKIFRDGVKMMRHKEDVTEAGSSHFLI